MLENDNTLRDQALLDVIRFIGANRESGQLQITAQSTCGVLFFADGRLVDARLGSLTGFQAVNAAAGIREAQFSFDPSVAAPTVSSINSNERLVLKRFFDIDTIEPHELDDHVPPGEVNWDLTPTQVVPLTEVMDSDNPTIEPASTSFIDPDISSSNEADYGSIARQEWSTDSPAPAVPSHSVSDAQLKTLDDASLLTGESVRSTVRKNTAYDRTLFSSSQPRAALVVAALLFLAVLIGMATLNLSQHRDATPVAQTTESPSANVLAESMQTPSESPATVNEADTKKIETTSLSVPAKNREKEQASSVAHDLSGEWKVINVVEKTGYSPFNNMRLGFRLMINQTGNAFTGKGEKISENGRSLPPSDRTAIHVTGSIDGAIVKAKFVEDGALRRTSGRFVWTIGNTSAGLAGTFNSTAGRTSGKSAATKEL